MNSKFIKKLLGYSGCDVLLEKVDNKLCVSKVSPAKEYNFRLKKQLKKQLKYIPIDNVHTPKIYTYGQKDDLFYFSMEFIQGKTLAEYMEYISVSEITVYISYLFNTPYINNAKLDNKASKIFEKKLISLENSCKNHIIRDRYVESAFVVLKSFDWSKVYKSACHGDLTLENILITKNKKLYLIDFLDSFYNSWMIDVAKLLQDLELKLSFRNQKLTLNKEIRLLVAKEALIKEILNTKNGEENLNTIYHILLLNIIRIYPYAKDEHTISFIDNALINILKTLSKYKAGASI